MFFRPATDSKQLQRPFGKLTPSRFGAVWRGPRDNVIDAILHEIKKRAKDL
jgi:hypothetical protein